MKEKTILNYLIDEQEEIKVYKLVKTLLLKEKNIRNKFLNKNKMN
jgi:hypothetical protein